MNKIKLKNYLVLTLVSFLSVIGVVNAETTVNFDLNASMDISKTDYVNLKCTGDNLSAFTIAETDTKYTFKYANATNDGNGERVTCTWDRKYTAGGSDSEPAGSEVYLLKPNTENKEVMFITIGYDDYVGEGYSYDVFSELDASKIISSTVNPEGGEYITANCSEGTVCTVTPTARARENSDTVKNSYLDVVYLDKNNVQRNTLIKFFINIYDGARAYYGDVGTCSFDSSTWEKRTWTEDDGKIYRFYQSTSSNAVLPSCTPKVDSVLPVEFKGWTKGHDSNSQLHAIGECNVTDPPGTRVSSYQNYSACYEAKLMVQLALSEGTVSNLGNPWESASGLGIIGYYATADSSSTQYALPNVTFAGFSAGSSLVAWENQSTGERKQPGDMVSVDGSVWVGVIERTTQSSSSRNKTIYVGDQVTLSSTKGATTDCSSSNASYVGAYFNGSACTIVGNANSNEQYIDVSLTVSGLQEPVIYKVKVIDKIPSSGSGGDEDFIIDTTPGIDYSEVHRGDDGTGGGDDGSGGNSEDIDMSNSMCESFDVSAVRGSRTYFATEKSSGHQAYSTLYKAVPVSTDDAPCDTSAEYVALCLDPGRRGPTESNSVAVARYNKVSDINPNEDLGMLMTYLVQNIPLDDFRTPTNSNRIAAHFSARLVAAKKQMTAGYDATSSDQVWKAAYLMYQTLASAYNSSMSADEVTTMFDTYLTFTKDGVKEKAVEILSSFAKNNEDLEGDASSFHKEGTMNATAYGGSGYQIVHEGTIAFPSGAVGVANGLVASSKCADYGVTCTVNSWTKDEGATASQNREVWKYKITITADNAANVKIPKTEKEEKEVSFEVKYTGSGSINSIMLTQAQGSYVSVLQRMLVVALTNPSVFVYFPIVPNICLDISALDPDNCTAADNCSPTVFNKELFKEANCCDQITNEEQYAYLINSVCGGQCTTSTMVEICEYSAENVGKADLYEIKEGTRYEGSAQEGDAGVQYSYDLGTCVANVSDEYDTTYGGGLSNNTDFEKYDDVSEVRNVPNYEDNMYCQVTCREDWQISMDAFGNYVGKNAVAAGTFFQIINNDVFMSGSRFCYTSYLDYDQYMDDLTTLSNQMVNAYNNYSKNTHLWTNLNNTTQSEPSFTCSPQTEYGGYDCRDYDCDTDGDGVDEDDACTYCWLEDETSDNARICTLSPQVGTADNDKNDGKYKHYETEVLKEVTDQDSDELDVALGIDSTNTKRESYLTSKSSTCTPNYSSWPCSDGSGGCQYVSSYSGDCTNAEGTQFSTLKTEMMFDAESAANSALGQMQSAKTQIEQRAEDFFECQYFQFFNVSDGEHGYTSMSIDSDIVLGKSKDYTTIYTAFDPTASYEYDEEGFMHILKKNQENYLEIYSEKNEEVLPGYAGFEKDERTELKDGKTGTAITTPAGDQAYLSRNYTETYFYNPEERWEEVEGSVTNYNTYGETDTGSSKKREDRGSAGGENADNKNGKEKRTIILCDVKASRDGEKKEWTAEPYDIGGGSTTEYKAGEGGCYTYVIEYTSTHYIMSSIQNSSYYKNQGYWWQSYGVDMKEHGADKQTALSNASNRGTNYFSGASSDEVLKRWGRYGDYNTFPISMTTPRGLYQYEYSFFNVGVYPFAEGDEPELGRVMGFEESLIKMNTRVCFYEVFEEVCLCCGDELNVHYDEDDYVVDEFLGNYSGPYDYSQSLLGEIISSSDGTISLATSSISLANLYPNSSGGSGNTGTVAGNWAENTPFLYNGNNNLTTDKGAHLLKEIEAKGETIYDNNEAQDNLPEYSYYLTPSTLTAIREYNDTNGYEVNYNNLKVYGKYTIAQSNGNWGEGMNDTQLDEYITFVHFGSKFLEDFMEPYTYADSITLGQYKNENSNVCVIEGKDSNFDGTKIKSMVRNQHCRWIDYIEDDNGEKYRLAFK